MSLVIEGLRVRQGDFALGPIDLRVEATERLLVIGPSGSGKTTLLRALAGLVKPVAGRIALGESLFYDGARGNEASMPPERRGVGMVFQDLALWPHLSVRAHLALVLRYQAMSRDAAAIEIERTLRRFQLWEKADRKPGELSGGEGQRLALARALVSKPRLLLLDEPFGHLDPHRRREAMEWIEQMHRENPMPLLHVTHDLLDLAAWEGRIALINAGAIEQLGTLPDLLRHPRTDFVGEFLRPLLDCKIWGNTK